MSMTFFNISSASCVSRSFFRKFAISFASSLSKLPLVGTSPALSSYILPHTQRALLVIFRFFVHLQIPNSRCSFQYFNESSFNYFVYCVAMFHSSIYSLLYIYIKNFSCLTCTIYTLEPLSGREVYGIH